MIFWLLAREILILRGKLQKNQDWEVMVDLFYAKAFDELKKDDKAEDGEEEEENQDQEEDESQQEKDDESEEKHDDDEDWNED